jgi:23S rRNA (cytosine1962-C5)-methyltransferase
LIIFEDEHLLVVNKPGGMNTHAPSPYAGEGIYDWLRHREPRWARLAIIHRLDKETSGVMVFGKTALANRSLTGQFTRREIRKKYLLLTDRPPKQRELTVKSKIARAGERYVGSRSGELAETRFRPADRQSPIPNTRLIEAEPLTGRTHQIRVHAAESGFPIFGDTLYGGSAFSRVCLHAAELILRHPGDGKEMIFTAPADFAGDSCSRLRAAVISPEQTNAFRLIHGASDGWPGWYVDRLGAFLLSQSECEPTSRQQDHLRTLPGIQGVYHKLLNRQVRRTAAVDASPRLVCGEAAPPWFLIQENGTSFELSLNEGYSVGLFLDQRDNRRRWLTGHIAAGFSLKDSKFNLQNSSFEVLNAFAYTCGFSVCAAKAGARVTSLDLSKKYLEWGRRNFTRNGVDPDRHDFIYGDAFDWLRRLAKQGRLFDAIVLDPPTFSQSKERGAFRVEKDYGRLASAALALLKANGLLFASTNAADWEPEKFLETLSASVHSAGRKVLQQHYAAQAPDFPVSRAEPAHLKSVWLRLS